MTLPEAIAQISAAMQARHPGNTTEALAARYASVETTLAIMLLSPRSRESVFAAFVNHNPAPNDQQ